MIIYYYYLRYSVLYTIYTLDKIINNRATNVSMLTCIDHVLIKPLNHIKVRSFVCKNFTVHNASQHATGCGKFFCCKMMNTFV